jgi:GR25 family glycosyltransferase involved in LPS biosynthesis
MFNWRECYISFVNLSHRADRLHHITSELARVGILAERTEGMYPNEFDRNDPKLQVQWKRTPGSIGCMYSQMKIMRKAYSLGRSAMIFEDDVILCSDIKERLDYLQNFLNRQDDWSVAWLGGTVHINPPQWHTGTNPDLIGTELRKDAERTDDPRIIKCYGAFSTFAYIVHYENIPKVLELLESVMYLSMGIDWSFIKLGAQINTFMFLPGMAKQIDNKSDIGNGITYFSGFSRLGDYWFQDKSEMFDPSTLQL